MKNNVYTLGCGDRFGFQGKAQLSAFVEAAKLGIEVYPVWNKSYREHTTVQTIPSAVRAEANAATEALGWAKPYFVDADHISLKTVDRFVDSSDFFTLDVADFIGEIASKEDLDQFIDAMTDFSGEINVPGFAEPLRVSKSTIRSLAEKYLFAIQEAGRIYRHIAKQKEETFIVEVSMDETDEAQTPTELLFILAMVAREGIPVDTIAPKFSGRFNKGVDYVGDVAQFETEFEQDVMVLRFASENFGLKPSLRLSVHSGSDKFSIYPPMNRIIKKYGVGLHLKTAGTTWLEEVIGLAESGGEGLAVAKKIYANALARYDELAAPYATVIDIHPTALPTPETVSRWSGEQYANALRHDPANSAYNASFRQLIHVAYKIAAELGEEYFQVLEKESSRVGENVANNLLKRHILPLFG